MAVYQTGQDLFIPGRKFIISGLDVLEVDSRLNRKDIEAVLQDAREMPVDEYAGFTEGAEVLNTQMSFGEDCIDAWFDKSLA
jgi:vacuolar-type H+-ATPase subunit B/Vma2